MLRKNVAGQYLYFVLVNATTGEALTGATVTAYRSLDGAAQAAVTGTITELGNGQYRLNCSQADTNANEAGYLFTATGAVPVGMTVVFTAGNPTDSVRFGLTALPNAAAGANGGLPTGNASGQVAVQVGTGAGQLSISAGVVSANTTKLAGQSVTATGAVAFPASVGSSTLDAAAVRAAVGLAAADLDTQLAGISSQTDQLVFTEAGQVDATVAGYASGQDPWTLYAAGVVEGSTTAVQSMRGWNAALLGKASGLDTGAPKYRDLADSKDRISATTDSYGNRSAVTRNLT